MKAFKHKNNDLNIVIDSIILYLSCFLLFIDSVNGYMLHNAIEFPMSLSQIYKSLLILLMGIRVFTFSLDDSIILLLYLIILCVPSVLLALSEAQVLSFKVDFVIIFRLFMIISSFFYFKGLMMRYPQKTDRWIRRIIYINFFVLSLNMLLGYLGFGFSQYQGGEGTKGFFYAGNEISGTMIILFSYVLFRSWGRSGKAYLAVSLLLLILAVLKTTKVAILGVLILVILMPLLAENKSILKITRLRLALVAAFFFMTPIISFFIYKGIEHTGLLGRLEYFYHKYDFLTFILSGRNELTQVGLSIYNEEYTFLEKVLGKSFSGFKGLMETRLVGRHTVEIDYFDLLFYFGFLGSFFIMLFYLRMLIISFKGRYNKYALLTFMVNVLLIMISFTAGHVLYSGLAGVFIGVINSLPYYDYES